MPVFNKPTTVGFCGPGYVDERNAKKLIEFWYFGDVLLAFHLPPKIPKGIANVYMAAEEIFAGRDVISETPRIIDLLLEDRENGQEVELVVLWGPGGEGDWPGYYEPETIETIAQARQHSIRVRNMCQAMYDLPDNYLASQPETVVEEAESDPKPVKIKNRRERQPKPEPAAASATEPRRTISIVLHEDGRETEMSIQLAEILRDTLTEKIEEAMHPGTRSNVQHDPVQKRPEVKEEDTKAYIPDGLGSYKPRGRGKPRAADKDKTLFLTDDEARERGFLT